MEGGGGGGGAHISERRLVDGSNTCINPSDDDDILCIRGRLAGFVFASRSRTNT